MISVFGKFKEMYDDHIVLKTRLENLRDNTQEKISEFKRLNERLVDKVDAAEREIASLKARLDAISEKAMLAAAAERAEEYIRRTLAEAPERAIAARSPDGALYPRVQAQPAMDVGASGLAPPAGGCDP